MKNIVIESILSRRSVRNFKQEQIRDEELNQILQAAVWAPSGSNSQSWLFTAVQNPEILAELNALLCRGFREWQPGEHEYAAKLGAKKRAEHADANFLYHAPTLVIASNVPDYANAMADCSCALQNIFLASYSLEIGSCWINQFTWLNDYAPLRERLAELGLPKEHVICGAAALGYPNGEAPKPPVLPVRKENTVHIIR